MRRIWRCIIRLIYGSDDVVPEWGNTCAAKRITFLINIYACAELLGLDNSILLHLKAMLRDVDAFWKLVSDFPGIFLDVGYYLAMPDVYLDAIKHLASDDLENR